MAAECAADQLLGGRYALVEVLGHGASGVVWRARDQLLQREMAVKEIRSPLMVGLAGSGAFRDAILREARAAARLNHPGAVTVYDVVEDDGRPLIVMELVDAPTLWALGATLYFAVEGRPPYDKGGSVPTMMAIVREPPRPPARAGALGPLLAALLDKDPEARPTAAFLRLWLTEVAGGSPWSNDLD